jgi:hypothetical protein
MSSKIAISRRVCVVALVVALLLLVLVVGSSWVRAQGLPDYQLYTPACVGKLGLVRVVDDPADCSGEVVYLLKANYFTAMEDVIDELEERLYDLEQQQ